MTFASESNKLNSERITLVNFQGAYDIPIFVPQGGDVFSCTISQFDNIGTLFSDGVALTEVSIYPTAYDTYQIDGNSLYVKLTSSPSLLNLVLTFDLYYTTGKTHFEFSDPQAGTGTKVKWESRISNTPKLSQTMKNIVDGIVSLSSSSIDVINADGNITTFLGSSYSFYNMDVKIWIGVKSKDQTSWTYRRDFTGVVKDVTAGAITTFSLTDPLEKLKQTATMGRGSTIQYIDLDNPDVTSLQSGTTRTPIPYVFTSTPSHITPCPRYEYKPTGSTTSPFYMIDPDKAAKATCVNYTPATSSSALNDKYLTVSGECTLKTVNFGTITAFAGSSTGTVTDKVTASTGTEIVITTSGHNVEVGDQFTFNPGTLYYCYVFQVTATTIRFVMSTNGIHASLSTGHAGTNFLGSVGSLSTLVSLPVVHKWSDGKLALGTVNRTYSYSVTGNGTYELDVDPTSSYGYGGSVTLDPDTVQTYYRHTCATASTHADVVNKLLTEAGLTLDSTSKTQADTDLDANVVMTVPTQRETRYNDYLKYLQDVLGSTMGMIRLKDNSSDYEYKIIQTPSGSETRTDYDSKYSSISYNYRDLVSEVRFYNLDHGPRYTDTLTPDSTTTITNSKTQYLHNVNKVKNFVHVLDDMSSRAQDIADVITNRRATYKFKTASKDLDTKVADELTLSHEYMLANKDVIVTKVVKSEKETEITAEDLGDL